MIFFANRANLDKRTLLTRLHNQLQTQVSKDDNPIERVWYQTSTGNKVGVCATLTPEKFLRAVYPVDEAELQVSFSFPSNFNYDFYKIQWVEPEREFMVGWHQDETHTDLGECYIQLDCQGETVQREEATFLDRHPRNVADQRAEDLVDVLNAITWQDDLPNLPQEAIR